MDFFYVVTVWIEEDIIIERIIEGLTAYCIIKVLYKKTLNYIININNI